MISVTFFPYPSHPIHPFIHSKTVGAHLRELWNEAGEWFRAQDGALKCVDGLLCRCQMVASCVASCISLRANPVCVMHFGENIGRASRVGFSRARGWDCEVGLLSFHPHTRTRAFDHAVWFCTRVKVLHLCEIECFCSGRSEGLDGADHPFSSTVWVRLHLCSEEE